MIITDVKDKKGFPIVVVIYPNSNGYYQNVQIETNTVASAYGKDENFTEWLTNFLVKDKIFWMDNKKADSF